MPHNRHVQHSGAETKLTKGFQYTLHIKKKKETDLNFQGDRTVRFTSQHTDTAARDSEKRGSPETKQVSGEQHQELLTGRFTVHGNKTLISSFSKQKLD